MRCTRRGRVGFAAAMILCFLFHVSSARAAPGDLDPSFGSGGRVISSFGTENDFSGGVAIQADSKIVAVGSTSDGVFNKFSITRYNPDGTLDTGFGSGGTVMTAFGTQYDQAYAVAIQADGKIVAAGYTRGSTWDFAVARYQPDGTMDTSFGIGGKVITPIGASTDVANAIAIQSDGKIVVAGRAQGATSTDFALVRYNTDGSLDTSFGSGGKIVTSVGTGRDEARAVAIQADAKIVVAGLAAGTVYSAASDFALVRYNADGTLDAGFGGGGMVVTAMGTGDDAANAVAIQPDGKIVAAGTASGTTTDFALARYNADGTLDSGFGSGGKVVTAVGTGADAAKAVLIQPDGKIVAIGSATRDFAVVRYTAAGALDTSFNGTGKVTTAVGLGTFGSGAVSAALQADGKIVALGESWSGLSYDAQLVRYGTDGSLDTSFGSGGKATTDAGVNGDIAQSVAAQPDGKVLVAGSTYSSNGQYTVFALSRLSSNGSLDSTFGAGGRTTAYFGTQGANAYALAIQPDGKIVLAGGSGRFAVARHDINGALDTTFNGSGTVTTLIGTVGYANAVAIQPDGKIVVAGSVGNSGNWDIALARYNSNGTLDTNFGSLGKVIYASSAGDDSSSAVAIQPDGKILVAGLLANGTGSDSVLLRFAADGAPDATFGNGGKAMLTAIGGNAFLVLPDGKILVAGSKLARLNADGSPDSSFGSGGTTDLGCCARALTLDFAGRVLVAGSGNATSDLSLFRFLADGTPDASFGSGGKAAAARAFGSIDWIRSVTVQPGGSILAAGEASYYVAVAKYLGADATSSTTTTTTTTTTLQPITTTTSSTTTAPATTTTVASTTTTTLTGSSATLNVVAGWNLVGNGSSGSLDVAAAFGNTSNVITVWKWIANGAKWAFYAPSLVGQQLTDYANTKGYDVLTTIAGGEGFWVNAKISFTAQLPAGTAITSASYQTGLVAGWNLIAIGDNKTPSQFNLGLSATPPVAGDIPINLTTLWAWDAALTNWYFYAPSLEKSGGLAAYITSKSYLDFGTNVLTPTAGFWVNKP